MIRPYRPDDRDSAMALLVDSFAGDPGWTSLFPEDTASALAWVLPRQFDARLARGAVAEVAEVDGQVAGIAVRHLDDQEPGTLDFVWQGLLWMPVRFGLPAVRRVLAAGDEATALVRAVGPSAPFLVGAQLAVDARFRGRGIGGVLARSWRERAEGRPVALMTTKADNVAFYERNGYRLAGQDGIVKSFTAWVLVAP